MRMKVVKTDEAEELRRTGSYWWILIKHIAEDGLIRFAFLKCQQGDRIAETLLQSSRWDMIAVGMKQER